MEKEIIFICSHCRKAKGTIPVEDILFFQEQYWCQKCWDQETEEFEELLENID